MDPLWIVAAFFCGSAVSRIGLPPLVGYLAAGFILNGLGIDGGPTLEKAADIGVTLLLFTIGLKLKLKALARPEVWGGATRPTPPISAIWPGRPLYCSPLP